MKKTFENILAIDSSTSVLRVGLRLANDKIIALENEDRYRHAEFIFKLIDDVLTSGSINKNQLEAIVISTGPGSFTGLRVGMSAVKGLASALDIPLVGVSTFNAVAKGLFENFGPTAVLIPSRRDEFYFGLIESPRFDLNNIEILKTDEVELRVNDLNVYGIDFYISTIQFDRAERANIVEYDSGINDFITTGLDKLNKDGGDDLFQIEPYYAQKFVAQKAKKAK